MKSARGAICEPFLYVIQELLIPQSYSLRFALFAYFSKILNHLLNTKEFLKSDRKPYAKFTLVENYYQDNNRGICHIINSIYYSTQEVQLLIPCVWCEKQHIGLMDCLFLVLCVEHDRT